MSFSAIPAQAVARLQARTTDQLRSDYTEAARQANDATGEQRELLFTALEWVQEVLASRIGWVEAEKFDDGVWKALRAPKVDELLIDGVLEIASINRHKGAMSSSATLCVAEAGDLVRHERFPEALGRALKSLAYSVGVLAAEYVEAVELVKAAGFRVIGTTHVVADAA